MCGLRFLKGNVFLCVVISTFSTFMLLFYGQETKIIKISKITIQPQVPKDPASQHRKF